MSEKIEAAESAMGIEADHKLVLDQPTRRGDATHHRHLAIEWEGGVLWLDMSDLVDHYCVDVRQFRGDRIAATGVFGIENGRSFTLDNHKLPEDQRVLAHGWPATFMPILLMDKDDPTTEPGPADR